jgi:CDP-diacylglycerol---glycerol-3-phosphate 3-phosphatidyltransferase
VLNHNDEVKLGVSYMNKVNAITLSRIVLTVFGVLLIFSGNIKLLIVAYVIMSLSEVSDIVDGYVARRDKLVTDLGKILDPLSDSISRFFYFFALAYHGLFPIWFIVFFFFRDIIVAYVRIFASFSGTVMGARFSGKLKGGVQFGGQYLLMYALMANTIHKGGEVSDRFIAWSVITGIVLNLLVVYIFRIKGGLLYLILSLMGVLSFMLFMLGKINFSVNYLTTFSISFIVISVTLYSLSDYLFSLVPKINPFYNYITGLFLVGMMYLISPYFLDLVKNKVESNAEEVRWKSYDVTRIEKRDGYKITGITTAGGKIIASASGSGKVSRLYVFDEFGSSSPGDYYVDFPENISNVMDLEQIGDHIYVIDDNLNSIFGLNKTVLIENKEIAVDRGYHTGFTSSATLCAVKFNSKNFIVINDYIFSGHLHFCLIEGLSENSDLTGQTDFRVKSEFYIKNLFSQGKLIYVIANKIGKDLIYVVDAEKAILAGKLQDGIIRIITAPDSDLKGISLIGDKIISYGNRSKKIYVEDTGRADN